RPGFDLFDYDVYALCGDGCMMEGVSSEAASLAGHLGLGNLCWIYDNNGITIEGSTDVAFTEDVESRFRSYGWNVVDVDAANDLDEIERALGIFRATGDRPTLIVVHSHIGFGSPHRQDTSAAHGEPLGADEIRLTKAAYGWPPDATFYVPDGVREHFAEGIGRRGAAARQRWEALFAAYRDRFPQEARAIDAMQRRGLPPDWDAEIPGFPRRHERSCRPRCLGARHERRRAARAVVDRRRRRSRALHEDASDRRRRRPPDSHARRTQPAFRRARARDGLDPQRPRLDQAAAVRRRLPDLQRLRARRDSPERADGAAGGPHLHARLDWRGRRWSNASADRAADLAACDPAPHRAAPGRCQRSRRSLARDHDDAPPPGRVDPVAAAPAHPRPPQPP